MVQQLAFVSCDIIGHSAESDLQRQRDRIAEINAIVADTLAASANDTVIWASGGDGGHVAFAIPGWVPLALNLICRFRAWSEKAGVRLRIVAHYGQVDRIEGAGGITQLVGPGINLAGRLLAYGDQHRVVVTKEFADAVQLADAAGARFHDAQVVPLKYFPAQEVMLLSIDNAFESRWDNALTDDRSRLEASLHEQRCWDVIYYSRRLMEVNAQDENAIAGLVALAEQGLTFTAALGEQRVNPLLGPMDRYSRVDFIGSAQLVEREQGSILCRYEDDGDTMFVIVRGEVAVVPVVDAAAPGVHQAPPRIRIGVGGIVGELAYALNRKRTATLQCVTNTALLSFSPQSVESVANTAPSGATIRQAMNRFVKLRILEHLCNNADYLIGRDRNGPLKDLTEPWVLLIDNTTVIHCPAGSEQWISRQHKEFRGRGLYVLVSGELQEASDSDVVLKGTSLPIIYVDIQGAVSSQPKSYQVVSDATIIRISQEAFANTFIPRRTFQSLVSTMRAEVVKGEPPAVASRETRTEPHPIQSVGKVKILFLAANPAVSSPLQLDREARRIEEVLRGTRERDQLELITKWAVRADDLQQYLLEHQPHIVHFSGHGTETDELVLEDNNGKPRALRPAALVALFRALKDNIRVVVLNACFSQRQAEAITETIDCAIGMNKAIGDNAAIAFAAALYRALGYGRSLKTAFDLGNAALIAEGASAEAIPAMFARAGVDTSAMTVVRRS